MDAPRIDTIAIRFAGRRLSRRQALVQSGLGLAVGTLAAVGMPALGNTRGASASNAAEDFAGLVDIGGQSLFLERRGHGSPTVVFESGFRDTAASWSTDLLAEPGATPEVPRTMVLPGVAAFTSVVAYDRPGTILSRSDPVPMPRSATDVVNDLHRLLVAAEVRGPYVLVGHSLGGLFVRLYASTYPDEVAGMVLVDAWSEGLREALTPKAWRTYVDFGLAIPEELQDDPNLESVDFEAVADAITQAESDHPLPEIPLYVITAGLPFDISEADVGFSPDAWQDAWSRSQDQLAMLLPDARHVIAQHSGHNIHQDQPELVIEAIRQVVDAVRDPSSWAVSTPIASGGDVAGLVDIGGRSLYLECRGSGSPTVILEAGAGNDADVWDSVALSSGSTEVAVFPGVAAFTRVCAYDRPNTFLDSGSPGRSDPAPMPMPRTVTDMVADLHALLTTADVPGPYVLVGHSFGGLIVRLYASRYPDDVSGLVLVDAAHEDYYAAIQAVLTPEQWMGYTNAPEDPGFPHLEKIDTDASAIQMRSAVMISPLRPMPLVVLTHGQPWDWPATFPAAALEDVWLPLQRQLASLVPGGRLVVAEKSGHFIQVDEPDLVIDAIRHVVDAVRDPDTWSATPAATPT